MSKNKTKGDASGLPEPVALTPQEAQQVAAGSAAALSSTASGGGATTGYRPPTDPPLRQVE